VFQIWITVAQIAFGIIQTVIFTIGFSRAFASIRRKMMLNILMQVLLSQPELSNYPSTLTPACTGHGVL
jgi:hypothetical protein